MPGLPPIPVGRRPQHNTTGAPAGFSGAFPRPGGGPMITSASMGTPRTPGVVQRRKPNIQNQSFTGWPWWNGGGGWWGNNNWWGNNWWGGNAGYYPWWNNNYLSYPYYDYNYGYAEVEEDPLEIDEYFPDDDEFTQLQESRYCRRVVRPFCRRNPDRRFCVRHEDICADAAAGW